MAIDARERPINIKNLVVENRERSMPFDLTRDVKNVDIHEIKREVYNSEKEKPETGFYLRLASKLRILYPNLEIVLSEKVIEEKVLPQLVQYKEAVSQGQSLTGILIPSSVLALKTLFPSRKDFYLMTDRNWFDVSKSLRESKAITGVSTGAEYLRDFKILSPDRFDQLGLGDLDQESMVQGIEEDRRDGYRSLMSLVSLAASARILFPKKFGSLVRDDEIREAVKYMHNQRKRGNRDFFLNVAFDLAILTADNVIIDNRGLTIVAKKGSGLNEPVPLPETKKF